MNINTAKFKRFMWRFFWVTMVTLEAITFVFACLVTAIHVLFEMGRKWVDKRMGNKWTR